MNKPLWIVVLVAGLALLLLGVNAANSVSSETTEALTGTPSDKALWLMVGGAVAALIGLVGVIDTSRGRRTGGA